MVDFGLLLIRVVLGALFIGHGTQKLYGWFGGHGLAGTGGIFESLGYRRGRTMAFLAGASEAAGGALVLLGLLFPFGLAALIGVMLNAIVAAHWPRGLWVTQGGYEYPLFVAVVATALAFIGPGGYAVDAVAGGELRGPIWGMITVVLAALGAFMVLSSRRPAAVETAEGRRRAA